MDKEGILKKIWLYLLLGITLFAITAVAQTNETAKITGEITNNGPLNEGEEITFTGSCTGENTKLVLCRDNVICNAETSEVNILCSSETGNEEVKTCTYLTTSEDISPHDEDIATCCNEFGCDVNTISVKTWSALKKVIEQRLSVVDEVGTSIPVTIKEEGVLVDVSFTNLIIDNIVFTNTEGKTFGFGKELRGIIEPEGVVFSKTYSLDLDGLTFTEATLFSTASSSALYQCKFWSFELSICLGSWDFVKDLKVDESYSFNLVPGTFGFAEGGNATNIVEPPVVEPPVVEPPVVEPPIEEDGKVKIKGLVTNKGSVSVGSVITFYGSCTGKATQLVVCRENSICNNETSQENLLCSSSFTDESKKECDFIPSSFDEDIHAEDIATCCSATEGCDSSTKSVNTWIVTSVTTPLKEELVEAEEIVQEPAEVDKPVRWSKKIKLKKRTTNLTVKLPRKFSKIKVEKIVDLIKQEVAPEKLKTKKLEKPQLPEEETELLIEDTVDEVEILYETESPTIKEEIISKYKKEVTISSDIHYTNISTYTTITESQQEAIKLYWLVNGTKQRITALDYVDSNNNGLIDMITWTVPSLSNQTYIIEITKADHLDVNRNFINDIYDTVKALDNNWSETILDGEYVRIVFEQDLTSENDITIYPRTVSGTPKIEVYEVNGTEIIAEFNSIVDNELNKVFLDDLVGEQDTFDLKVIGGSIEFDWIVDPSNPTLAFVDPTPADGFSGASASIFVNTTTTHDFNNSLFVDFDDSVLAWWRMDDVNGSGVPVDYFGLVNGSVYGTSNAVQNGSGYFGKSFIFDGTGDDIRVPDHDRLDLDDATTGFTISVWVARHSSIGGKGFTIMNKGISNDRNYRFTIESDATLNFFWENEGGANQNTVSSGTVGTGWQHIVAMWNGSTNLIYFNGVLDTLEDVSGVPATNSDDLGIGEDYSNADGDFQGAIDDFIVFNRSLSAEEVRGLFANETNKIVGNNFTSLATGNYTFTAYGQDIGANLSSLSRTVTVDDAVSEPSPTVVGSIYSSSVTILAQSVNEDDSPGPAELLVSFTVSDADGVVDIDDSSANLTLINALTGSYDDGNSSINTTCFNEADIDSTTANFTCVVQLHYWFDPAEWNFTAGILDTSGVASVNHSNFTVQSTSAIVISLSSFDFGTLVIGQENTTTATPIVVNNTANTGVSVVNVLAVDLVGEEVVSDTIGANNFSVDVDSGGSPPLECTAATQLVNNSVTAIVGAVLASGNRSFGLGNETLYPCFNEVPAGLSAQAYSTLNGTAWTVSV